MDVLLHETRHFFLAIFKILSLSLTWYFDYKVPGYWFLWVHLIWTFISFLISSLISMTTSFPRFRRFSAIISLNMLSALSLSYSSSGISIMDILIYFMLSHKSLKFFTQFPFFFLFLLWLDNCKWPVFSSPWSSLLSSAWSSLLLKPYREFISYCVQLLYSLAPKISGFLNIYNIWYIYINYIFFVEIFISCIILLNSLGIFMMVILSSLSVN